MTSFERPFESMEELHETQMEYLKKMIMQKEELAVPAAVHLCALNGMEVPIWLTKILFELHCANLRADKPKGRGRTANPLAQYLQRCVHHTRWDTVRDILEKQVDLPDELNELMAKPNVPEEELREKKADINRVGCTREDAYRCAAEYLAKTESFGGVDAIKASYLLVKKAFRDPEQAIHFHHLDPRFISKIS